MIFKFPLGLPSLVQQRLFPLEAIVALILMEPGDKIIHDPRLNWWSTIDQVRQAGDIPTQSKIGQSLAKGVGAHMAAYPCSAAINYPVEGVRGSRWGEGEATHGSGDNAPHILDRTDGISLEFADWRFNLRGSNTEPLLRLNVEARGDIDALNAHVAEIAALIRNAG